MKRTSDQPFRFKQFEIHHHNCAHKVGFDGVLLGAWTDYGNATSILDIGTGSGLIALMAAQRQQNANIIAVEKDHASIQQAISNFNHSPFNKQIIPVEIDFLEFQTATKMHHVVFNPPFFISTTRSKTNERTDARQIKAETLKQLFLKTNAILLNGGNFSLIYPYEFKNEFERILEESGFFKGKETLVYTTSHTPERVLCTWSTTLVPIKKNELKIYTSENEYSTEYINLTKDFYPHFI